MAYKCYAMLCFAMLCHDVHVSTSTHNYWAMRVHDYWAMRVHDRKEHVTHVDIRMNTQRSSKYK